jgi:serine O-acetyltransferase
MVAEARPWRGRWSISATISSDLRAMAELKGTRYPSLSGLLDVLSLPGTWAALLARLSTWLHNSGLRPLSRIVYFANCVMFGCEIQPGARIGPGLAIAHPIGVTISSGARLGRDLRLMGGVKIGGNASEDPAKDGDPVVGDGCWFMDGAKAFGPISIGDRTVIATSSVATQDLPADVWASGVPARAVKPRAAAAGHPT